MPTICGATGSADHDGEDLVRREFKRPLDFRAIKSVARSAVDIRKPATLGSSCDDAVAAAVRHRPLLIASVIALCHLASQWLVGVDGLQIFG